MAANDTEKTNVPGPTAGLIRANPTPKQVRRYRRELRHKADAGDVTALGFLVLAETLREERNKGGE